ncbi:MAG: hypothetical protein HOE11_01785 [Candidatus Diapherotrites archaeon]|nr:hypothetical protein [Candidatus Diapherotrites archaeon]MBT4597388.1 hypothetical protein [Candidatus Diapherotrites archaeon]
MVFSMNTSPPSWSEIKAVLDMAKNYPELLDGREQWIYENCCKGGFE